MQVFYFTLNLLWRGRGFSETSVAFRFPWAKSGREAWLYNTFHRVSRCPTNKTGAARSNLESLRIRKLVILTKLCNYKYIWPCARHDGTGGRGNIGPLFINNKQIHLLICCLLITPTCFRRLLRPSLGCTILKITTESCVCDESVKDLNL